MLLLHQHHMHLHMNHKHKSMLHDMTIVKSHFVCFRLASHLMYMLFTSEKNCCLVFTKPHEKWNIHFYKTAYGMNSYDFPC